MIVETIKRKVLVEKIGYGSKFDLSKLAKEKNYSFPSLLNGVFFIEYGINVFYIESHDINSVSLNFERKYDNMSEGDILDNIEIELNFSGYQSEFRILTDILYKTNQINLLNEKMDIINFNKISMNINMGNNVEQVDYDRIMFYKPPKIEIELLLTKKMLIDLC